MNLTKLEKEQFATITKISANKKLKQRLQSFGVIKGAIVKMKTFSLTKNTFEIEINHSLIALRESEAKLIEVEK